MPAWSLQTARRTARSIAVWFVWVLLTGYLRHGKTYGDLRRLDRTVVVRQVALVGLTVAVLGWVATRMPPGAAAWVGSGLLLGAGFGGLVVFGYFAVTWFADYSLTR